MTDESEGQDMLCPHLEGDFDTFQAKYREICDVPGYRLRKPLEVALFEKKDRKGNINYIATHNLPSSTGDAIGTGIEGRGKTEDEACRELAKTLVTRFEHLREQDNLPSELINERRYFDSIIISDIYSL